MIVGGVGLVLLVLVAFVWAGPDAVLGDDAPATLAAADLPAPALRPRASAPAAAGTAPAVAGAATATSSTVPVATPSTASVAPSSASATPSTAGTVRTVPSAEPTPTTTVPAAAGRLAERLEVVPRVVRFPYRSAALEPAAAEVLDELAPDLVTFLAARPGASVLVRGHTDDSGPEEGNRRLGADRAQVVVDRLVGRGVPAAQVRGLGVAASMPLADNATDEGRAANRRVDIVVVTTETAGS